MKRNLILMVAIAGVFIVSSNALADMPDFRLSAGMEYIQGDTTSQYNCSYLDPKTQTDSSTIEYPINVYLVSADLRAHYKRFMLNVSVAANVSSPKDRASLTDNTNASSDSYGINTADIQTLDADLSWSFIKRQGWEMQIGGGYLQQDYIYNMSNANRYNVTYKIPYAELGLFFYTDKFKGEITYIYSPWVNSEDDDKNNANTIYSKGYDDGYMNKGIFRGSYNISKHWLIGLDFSLLRIDSSGSSRRHQLSKVNQKDAWYEVDNKITSEQITTLLKIGYKF